MWTLALGACALLFHGAYFNCGIKNLVDLGVMSVDSERILHGQVFARDFLAPYGPGRYYVIAAAFYLFGTSMTVLCGVFLLLRVLVDVCTFMLARRVLPLVPSLGVVLCAAFLHGPTHKGFLTLWITLLLLAAAYMLERPSFRRAFLLGAAVSLAGSFRYDLGVLGFVVSLVVLIFCSGERRKWIPFFCGAVLFALPVLLLILWNDPGRWLSMELSRAGLLKEAAAPEEGSAAALLSLVLLTSPPVVLLSLLFRRRGASNRLLPGVVALAGLLLFSQYAIEPKVNRLLQVGPPLFLCAFCIAHWLTDRIRASRIGWLCPLAVLGVAVWYGATESGGGSLDSAAVCWKDQVRVEGERAGFHAGPKLAERLQAVIDWADRNAKEDALYVSPSVPLLLFLTGKKNPAFVTDFSYILRNRDVQDRILETLEKQEVGIYLSDYPYKPGSIQGFELEKEAPLFFANLRNRYRLNSNRNIAGAYWIGLKINTR